MTRFVAETEKDTAKRHSQNYVTERERRIAREISNRLAAGYIVTPAQIDFMANVSAVMARRGEAF
ncbi:MAG TPA: hypothetical protein VLC51_07265 [Nitrospira sp.]|nr:hypothetical protein [Nitrospira sp.]